jgi:hypothetical protein
MNLTNDRVIPYLKTAGVLLIVMVSAGLTAAQAAPKQRTVWIDRENYLADPSATADCEDQANTGDETPAAGNDALSILKNVATKALIPPTQIDNCMQQKGYTKKVVTGSKLPPTRPYGYQQQQQGYPQQQPVYPQQQQQGYPQQQPVYPQQQGYPQQQPVYPQQQGYPQQQPVYPQQQGYPQQQPIYPQQPVYPK